MRFAIRDDDVCFHTDPRELEAVWGSVSSVCPISFSCIPFVGGFDVDSYTPERWALYDQRWLAWQTKETFPIGDNAELVSFLKEWCDAGRATIMLHGVHHDLYELAGPGPFHDAIRSAKEYLETVFAREVSTASPPNNSLGPVATRALEDVGLDILIAFGHLPAERPLDLANLANFLRVLAMYARHGRRRRATRPLRFRGHQEQPCYGLGPNTIPVELTEGLEAAIEADGNFVLATHYYHLSERPELLDQMNDLIAYAVSRGGDRTSFVPAEQLFGR